MTRARVPAVELIGRRVNCRRKALDAVAQAEAYADALVALEKAIVSELEDRRGAGEDLTEEDESVLDWIDDHARAAIRVSKTIGRYVADRDRQKRKESTR